MQLKIQLSTDDKPLEYLPFWFLYQALTSVARHYPLTGAAYTHVVEFSDDALALQRDLEEYNRLELAH